MIKLGLSDDASRFFFSIPTLRSRQLVWKISQSISEKEMANKDREKDEMGFQITRRGQPRGEIVF